jgi:hypothetical protein
VHQTLLQASRTGNIKLSVALSLALVSATIIDAMYVAMTEITKQTVYTGPVVLWTAIFLGVATILIATNIAALLYAKANRSSGYQTARNLFFAAAFVSLTIFVVACIYIEMQLKQS